MKLREPKDGHCNSLCYWRSQKRMKMIWVEVYMWLIPANVAWRGQNIETGDARGCEIQFMTRRGGSASQCKNYLFLLLAPSLVVTMLICDTFPAHKINLLRPHLRKKRRNSVWNSFTYHWVLLQELNNSNRSFKILIFSANVRVIASCEIFVSKRQNKVANKHLLLVFTAIVSHPPEIKRK